MDRTRADTASGVSGTGSAKTQAPPARGPHATPDPVVPGAQNLASSLERLPRRLLGLAPRVRRRGGQRQGRPTRQELAFRAAAAQAELRKAEEQLHEVRATIVGLALASRVLREESGRLTEQSRNRLQRMHDAELARLERLLCDERQPARELDLDELLGPLVVSLRLRGHRVDWRASGGRAWGRADDVTEIANILLENAARHAAGSVIRVAVLPDEEWTALRVSDEGGGVPASMRDRLFDRGSRSVRSPGRGIGLHLAGRLASDLGGELRLDADPGPGCSGASFTLVLPSGPPAP